MSIASASAALLAAAVEEHDPSHVFALFSGGHDSLCSTAIAAEHPRFTAAVHVNTGIGVERTREFVRETCRAQGWPLIEKVTPPGVYEDLVRRGGFPGPGAHLIAYTTLKERRLDELIREHKTHRHDRIALVTGVRQQESDRRMGTAQAVRRHKSRVWINPIIDWLAADRLPFMERRGLPRNPVVDVLHMSGECLCGAFAKPGELAFLAAWFPEVGERIEQLQRLAAEAGQPCRWGERPPERVPDEQMALPMELPPLCWSCSRRGVDAATERRGEEETR